MCDPKHLCFLWEPKKTWMARTRPRLTEARGLLWKEGSGSVLSRDGASGERRKAVPDTRKESCLWSGHISPPHLLQGGESVGRSRAADMAWKKGQEPLGFTVLQRVNSKAPLCRVLQGIPAGGQATSACALWEGGCVFIDLAVWVQGSLHGLSGPPGQASSSEPSPSTLASSFLISDNSISHAEPFTILTASNGVPLKFMFTWNLHMWSSSGAGFLQV